MSLDEAVSCRAVFVIVSESDGRAGRFWGQLYNLKMARDRPCVSIGSALEPMGGLSNGPIPDPHRPHNCPNRRVEKSIFQISASWLQVDENVNRSHFRIHWLVMKWCTEPSYSFPQNSKSANADREQYARSSGHCGDDLVCYLTWTKVAFSMTKRWHNLASGQV